MRYDNSLKKNSPNRMNHLGAAVGFNPDADNIKTTLDHYFDGPILTPSPFDVQIGEQTLPLDALGRLSGCPAGGSVSVDPDPEAIYLTVRHSHHIKNTRGNRNFVEIRRGDEGYFLYLDYIWYADTCPKGFGAVAFLRMAREAQRLGFTEINLLAAGGSGIKLLPSQAWDEHYWGYEYWPRLGFDAQLQPVMLELTTKLPHLAHMTKVSQIVEADLPWWKEHGDGWEMSFDLTPSSASWDTLNKFISERGLQNEN
jgi:hypothetical protein